MMSMSCSCGELSADTATVEPAQDISVSDGGHERALWRGPIGLEGVSTGDGRTILPNALRWDTLPLPLRWAPADYGEHDGAVVVGKITAVERDDEGKIIGTGEFDLGSENGREAFRQVQEGLTPGISMDLDDIVVQEEDEDGALSIVEGRVRAGTLVAIPAFEGARIATSEPETFDDEAFLAAWTDHLAGETFTGGDPDDEQYTASFNWVDDVGGLPSYIKRISKHLRKKGMTESHAIAVSINAVKRMCSTGDLNFPGSQDVNPGSRAEACAAVADWEAKKARARASSGETTSVQQKETHMSVSSIEEDQPALVAAATVFDAAWFENPGLREPTPLTVTDEGRVFGHIALWGTCHIASPQGTDVCTQPPRSASNYAYFKTGAVSTTKGDLPVGKITMSTVHAGPRLSSASTMQHYENTGTVGAFVNAGEDSVGIWVAGAARPGADHTSLKGAPVSGDWRSIGGSLEMVGALSVNVPGFPVPRPKALVAGGATLSLVASGVVEQKRESIGDRVLRRRKARLLAAKVARFSKEEKVRRTRAAFAPKQTFAYNPDQWRMPKGNGKLSGRFIDMPDGLLSDLEAMLIGDVDNGSIPEDAAPDLGDDLAEAMNYAEQASNALRAADGDAAKAAAAKADESVARLESQLQEVAETGAMDEDTAARVGEALDNTRTGLAAVKDSDLSLLGDEMIGADAGGDIGEADADAPDAGDIGAEPEAPKTPAAPEAPASDPGEDIAAEMGELAESGRLSEGMADRVGTLLDDLDEARRGGDPETVQRAVDDLEEALISGIDSGDVDVSDEEAEKIGGMISALADAEGAPLPDAPPTPDAPRADGPSTPEAYEPAPTGDPGEDIAAEMGELAESGRLSEGLADRVGTLLDDIDEARQSGDPETVQRAVDDLEEALIAGLDSGDFDVSDEEAERIGRKISALAEAEGNPLPAAPPTPEPANTDTEEADNVWKGFEEQYVKTADPDNDPAPEELREQYDQKIAEGKAPDEALAEINAERQQAKADAAEAGPPEPQGSDQQQNVISATTAADALQNDLISVVQNGGIDEDSAAAIGDSLYGLFQELDKAQRQINQGSGIGDMAAVQSLLETLEAQLMAAADLPGMSDEDADRIGTKLDDLYTKITALADSLKGDTSPPPFAQTKVQST